MLMNKLENSPLAGKKSKLSVIEQAVQRADRDGVPKAAADFGIPESTLEAWRENLRLVDEVALLEISTTHFLNNPRFSH